MEILIGACGWDQTGLTQSYYPADLPAEWRLSYFANEYKTVWVPSNCWRSWTDTDISAIAKDMPERFRMVLELNGGGTDQISSISVKIPQIVGACVYPEAGDSFFRAGTLISTNNDIVIAFVDMDKCRSLRELRVRLESWIDDSATASTALIFVESPQNVAKYLQEIKILIELMGY